MADQHTGNTLNENMLMELEMLRCRQHLGARLALPLILMKEFAEGLQVQDCQMAGMGAFGCRQ